jgi:hypothetical protein
MPARRGSIGKTGSSPVYAVRESPDKGRNWLCHLSKCLPAMFFDCFLCPDLSGFFSCRMAISLHFRELLSAAAKLLLRDKVSLTLKRLPNGENRGLLQQRLEMVFAASIRCY